MNYYPFHIGDYASATRHLSWEEDCAYRRLLDVYYTTEHALPLEPRAVCRLVMATTDAQRAAVQVVLEEFFVLTDIGWVNTRADAEIETMREKQQKQRDKANAMWEKRKAAAGISTAQEHGNASAMPRHQKDHATASKSDADAMPPTPTPTPTPKKRNTGTDVPTPDGVSVLVWGDFIRTRKAKLTQTALDGIASEARKAGWASEDALRECCARGWTGFKADWVANSHQARASPTETAYVRQQREKWETLTGRASKPIDITPQFLEIQQ